MCSAYVYITANKKNGTLYVGSTTELVKRIWEHKNKLRDGFTAEHNADRLVYFEEHATIMDAGLREKKFKKWKRKWKLELIESQNPEWKDLFGEITG